jgi:hypothetical protein
VGQGQERRLDEAAWEQMFIQVPNFTVSAVSPGLQSADVIAHFGAHLADPTIGPELVPYLDRVRALRYEFQRGNKRFKCTRQII